MSTADALRALYDAPIADRDEADWRPMKVQLLFGELAPPDQEAAVAFLCERLGRLEPLAIDVVGALADDPRFLPALEDVTSREPGAGIVRLRAARDRARAAKAAPSAPAAEERPAEVIVDPTGQDGPRTFVEALARVKDGGVVRARPGEYTETLTLVRPVRIEVQGPPGSVRVKMAGGPCLTSVSPDATVVGLVLERAPGPGPGFAAWAQKGRLVLDHVELRSAVHACLRAEGAVAVEVRDSQLTDGPDVGVSAGAGATVKLERCDLSRQGIAGALAQGGRVELRACKVTDSPRNALSALDGGVLEADDCQVTRSAGAALIGWRRGTLVARRCAVTDGKAEGAWAFEAGTVRLEGGEVARNAGAQVTAGTGGQLHVAGAAIRDGGGNAATAVGAGSVVTLLEAVVERHPRPALAAWQGGRVEATGVHVRATADAAVWLFEQGAGKLAGCDLSGNTTGLLVQGGATVEAQGGLIQRSALAVHFREGGGGTITGTGVLDCERDVLVDAGATPALRGVRVGPDRTPAVLGPEGALELLRRAAQTHDASWLRLAIACGLDPRAVIDDGRTPLHVAARVSDPLAARALVAAGADLEAADASGRTPLFDAVAQPAVFEALLALGARVDAVSTFGETLAHAAAQVGHPDVLRRLGPLGVPLDALTVHGEAALHRAVHDPDRVRALVEAGASPSVAHRHGATPLHQAILLGCDASARALIDAGADLAATDAAGRTPLQVAERERRAELAAAILARTGAPDPRASRLPAGAPDPRTASITSLVARRPTRPLPPEATSASDDPLDVALRAAIGANDVAPLLAAWKQAVGLDHPEPAAGFVEYLRATLRAGALEGPIELWGAARALAGRRRFADVTGLSAFGDWLFPGLPIGEVEGRTLWLLSHGANFGTRGGRVIGLTPRELHEEAASLARDGGFDAPPPEVDLRRDAIESLSSSLAPLDVGDVLWLLAVGPARGALEAAFAWDQDDFARARRRALLDYLGPWLDAEAGDLPHVPA